MRHGEPGGRRARRRAGRLLPAALAVAAAGIGFTAGTAGFVALAPVAAAALMLWRVLGERGRTPRLLAVVAVVAAGSLVGVLAFADGSLRDFTRAQQISEGCSSPRPGPPRSCATRSSPRARGPRARCARAARSASRRRRGSWRCGQTHGVLATARRRPRRARRPARRRRRRHLPQRQVVLGVARAGPDSGRPDAGMRSSRRASSAAVATCRGSAGAGFAGRAGEPRRVGREHAADRPAHPHEALPECGVAGRDHAGEQIGMSREVLRRALPGEVGAELERTLQERRAERVVAAQQRAARVRCTAAAAMSVTVSVGLEGVSTTASAAPSQARRKPSGSRRS